MCVIADEDDQNGPYHDGEIEPNAPIVDIPNVELDPSLHLVERIGLAARAVNLRPARNPGLNVVTERVFLDDGSEVAFMRRGVRPRPHQRHVAKEHIEQLGQFVNAVPAQPTADPRDPFVALLRLLNDVAVFHDGHGAELEDPERAPVEAVPRLPEQRRTG